MLIFHKKIVLCICRRQIFTHMQMHMVTVINEGDIYYCSRLLKRLVSTLRCIDDQTTSTRRLIPAGDVGGLSRVRCMRRGSDCPITARRTGTSSHGGGTRQPLSTLRLAPIIYCSGSFLVYLVIYIKCINFVCENRTRQLRAWHYPTGRRAGEGRS